MLFIAINTYFFSCIFVPKGKYDYNVIRKSSINILQILWLLVFANKIAANEYLFHHINTNHGLSRNEITSIHQDKTGFMWFGTTHGLNRYDGNNFRVFLNSSGDNSSIADNYITRIQEDNTGNLWIGHRRGFCLYSPVSESFISSDQYFISKGYDPISLQNIFAMPDGLIYMTTTENLLYQYNAENNNLEILDIDQWENKEPDTGTNTISSIAQMGKYDVWIIFSNGLLLNINPNTRQIISHHDHLIEHRFAPFDSYQLFADSSANLWVFSTNEPGGLFYFDTRTNHWRHFSTVSPKGALSNNSVKAITQDIDGYIWVGTDHGGINIINLSDFTVRYLLNNPTRKHSLSQNVITSLFRDRYGMIWVGTHKNGINQYHKELFRFPLLQNRPNDIRSLPFNDINCFEEDNLGNLWIGTNGGGLLYYDRVRETFKQYQHDPANKGSISSNIIVSLLLDSDGDLWIGTYLGGLSRYKGEGRFEHFTNQPGNQHSLSDNKVWALLETSPGIIWIGTLNGGIDIFNKKNHTISTFQEHYNFIFDPDEINTIKKDQSGTFWVGTSKGLYKVDLESRAYRYFSTISSPYNALSNDNINALHIDSNNMVWIATQNGLNIYVPETGTFKLLTGQLDLPDNDIRAITEDNSGNLWISTAHGIALIENPGLWVSAFPNEIPRISAFNESDGLQGREFNDRSAWMSSSGEILFGGPSGFNIFDPKSIALNPRIPKIVFTELQVLNRTIYPGKILNNRAIIHKSIQLIPSITLKNSENIFSISFAALNFFNPSRNRFAYMLEGFSNEWVYLPNDEPLRVTYTNLSPGNYVFRVRTANNDGVWNNEGIEIAIKVLPPFYRTWIAYVFYIFLIFGILWFAWYLVIQKERMKFEMESQKNEARRQQELDRLKIRFFTNMSHEFRTPLSLIISPMLDLMKEEKDKRTRDKYNLIYRNTSRLLNMVNQLLDFRKIDVQGINLNMTNNDIIQFVRTATHNFLDMSDRKNINLTFHADEQQCFMDFDTDKLEKIIFNLLSNALKFTPNSGLIKVELITKNKMTDTPAYSNNQMITIKVTDTGIGIAPEKQHLIFNRYYQDEDGNGLFSAGTGIGLSLTQEFVKLHGGTISVESSPGKGSCFIVHLPGNQKVPEVALESKSFKENIQIADPAQGRFANEITLMHGKNTLLIVEDNEDFRFYLKDNLSIFFNIIEADNGYDGVELALRYIPQIIVSDVMMKGMDGFELCEKIKKNSATAHIPVILTTAQALENYRITGYNTGADAYLIKPFAIEVLKARIENLIAQKENFSYSWKTLVEKKVGQNPVSSNDELFIKKAVDTIEKQIANPDFSVHDFSLAMNVSRVHLYKKLMALTGTSPLDFIRLIRLKKAAFLLRGSQLTVAEICFQVGFNTPKYFASQFKKEYKVTPTEYRKMNESRR